MSRHLILFVAFAAGSIYLKAQNMDNPGEYMTAIYKPRSLRPNTMSG